jgi:hypothetical protein
MAGLGAATIGTAAAVSPAVASGAGGVTAHALASTVVATTIPMRSGCHTRRLDGNQALDAKSGIGKVTLANDSIEVRRGTGLRAHCPVITVALRVA